MLNDIPAPAGNRPELVREAASAQAGTVKLYQLHALLTLVAVKHFLFPCCLLLGFVLGATILPPFPDLGAPARPRLLARAAPLSDTVYVCLGAHARLYHASRACAQLTHGGHPVQALEAAQARRWGQWACQQCLIRLA